MSEQRVTDVGLRDRFRFQLATTEMRDKDQALSAFDAALAAANRADEGESRLREARQKVIDAARDLNFTMPDTGDGDPLSDLDDALGELDEAERFASSDRADPAPGLPGVEEPESGSEQVQQNLARRWLERDDVYAAVADWLTNVYADDDPPVRDLYDRIAVDRPLDDDVARRFGWKPVATRPVAPDEPEGGR